MWADFTHDNEMNAVLGAMGVLRMAVAKEIYDDTTYDDIINDEPDSGQRPLSAERTRTLGSREQSQRIRKEHKIYKEMDPANPDPDRKWVASRLVPFAARFVVEKLSCPLSRTNDTAVEAVRLLLNDAVLHIPGCREDLGSGVCTLEEFLETQSYARNGGRGDWEKCQKKTE